MNETHGDPERRRTGSSAGALSPGLSHSIQPAEMVAEVESARAEACEVFGVKVCKECAGQKHQRLLFHSAAWEEFVRQPLFI